MCSYRSHLKSSDDLITTYEATRAGFVTLVCKSGRPANNIQRTIDLYSQPDPINLKPGAFIKEIAIGLFLFI